MSNKQPGSSRFDTLLLHGGEAAGNSSKALVPPIHMSSSFTFDDLEHAEQVMSFQSSDYVYTRGNNPTLRLLESRMTLLEGGTAAVAFSSGMAAISSVLLMLLKPGDTLIAHRTLYGSTHTVTSKLLPRYGVHTVLCDLTDIGALRTLLEEADSRRIKAVFFETPSNPTLDIIDIAAVSEIAASINALTVVDNTFASPALQTPLRLGADIVVHSATKYLCGHGDSLGGVAILRDQNLAWVLKFDYMCELGGVMSPFNAWLILRGLKTLSLRMDRHCASAAAIAAYLSHHPRIRRVWYPGLDSFPGRKTAVSQMRCFGGMISFEIDGTIAEARKVIDRLSLIKIAVSLGDTDSLIQLPAAITHRGYDRVRLKDFGLTETMVRLAVGLEDVSDIIEDLAGALAN